MGWMLAGATVFLALGFWLARRRGRVDERIDGLIAEGREDRAIDLVNRRLPQAEGALRAELLRRRGECYSILGDLRAASTDYESCVELQPDRREHWEGLAEIYGKLGRRDAAERCARRVLELQENACPNVGPHD